MPAAAHTPHTTQQTHVTHTSCTHSSRPPAAEQSSWGSWCPPAPRSTPAAAHTPHTTLHTHVHTQAAHKAHIFKQASKAFGDLGVCQHRARLALGAARAAALALAAARKVELCACVCMCGVGGGGCQAVSWLSTQCQCTRKLAPRRKVELCRGRGGVAVTVAPTSIACLALSPLPRAGAAKSNKLDQGGTHPPPHLTR